MERIAIDRTIQTNGRLFLAFSLLTLVTQPGCAVYMAAHQPNAMDLDVLAEGTPRSIVIAELGSPAHSEVDDHGQRSDVHAFTQGYSKGNKVARTVGHAAMDFLTLGLWEVVGTPIEAVASGTDTTVRVTYDEKDNVQQVAYIQGQGMRRRKKWR